MLQSSPWCSALYYSTPIRAASFFFYSFITKLLLYRLLHSVTCYSVSYDAICTLLQCAQIKGLKFVGGGYRCNCAAGFEYPHRDKKMWIEGQLLENEFEKQQKGLFSRYGASQCRFENGNKKEAGFSHKKRLEFFYSNLRQKFVYYYYWPARPK